MELHEALQLVGGSIPETTTQTTELGQRPGDLWTTFDGGTPEMEVYEFLYGLTRVLKPRVIVEVGTWLGHAALFLGGALQKNGMGRMYAYEILPAPHAAAQKRVQDAGLTAFVEEILTDGIAAADAYTGLPVELLFVDCNLENREAASLAWLPKMHPAGVLVMHDTAAHHPSPHLAIQRLQRDGHFHGLNLPTPRGLFVARLGEPKK